MTTTYTDGHGGRLEVTSDETGNFIEPAERIVSDEELERLLAAIREMGWQEVVA